VNDLLRSLGSKEVGTNCGQSLFDEQFEHFVAALFIQCFVQDPEKERCIDKQYGSIITNRQDDLESYGIV